MRAFLSRYRLLYLKNLVYMLQATEYSVREYLAWYHRTNDFSRVAKRKTLVYTPKTLTLLAMAWLLAGLGLIYMIGQLLLIDRFGLQAEITFYLVILLELCLLPRLVAYLLVIPL